MTPRVATVWRVARRLALSGDPRQRWRQISLLVGSTVATVAILLGLGIVGSGLRVDAHLRDRSPVVADGVAFGIPVVTDGGHIRKLEEVEADMIRLALARYQGQMSEVARKLGIGRSTLYRRMKDLGLAATVG